MVKFFFCENEWSDSRKVGKRVVQWRRGHRISVDISSAISMWAEATAGDAVTVVTDTTNKVHC